MTNRMFLYGAPPNIPRPKPAATKLHWTEASVQMDRMKASGEEIQTRVIQLCAKLRNFAHINLGDLMKDLETVEGLIKSLGKMLTEHKARTNDSPAIRDIESLLREAEAQQASIKAEIEKHLETAAEWQK